MPVHISRREKENEARKKEILSPETGERKRMRERDKRARAFRESRGTERKRGAEFSSSICI